MTLMMTTTADHPTAPVTRRAKATRATSRRAPQDDNATRKVSFYLSPEAIRRLGVVASMEDSDKSKVLERVIRESTVLKRWVVSDRGGKVASGDSGDIGQDVTAA
jgi:hypothetical protein